MSVEAPFLKMGKDSPLPSKQEMDYRKELLLAAVKMYIPTLIEIVENSVEEGKKDKKGKKPIIMMHQDAFAAAYDIDEYTICGMAVKYAGLFGVEMFFVGKNIY